MMRRAVWLLLVVSAAVGLALLLRFQHGNVSILWAPYRIDLSVNFAVLILLGTFALLYLVIRAASQTLGLPRRVSAYRERRRHERAMGALREGLTALFEGRFGRAERLADKARADESVAGVAALVGARAAHAAQEPVRRDVWLDAARESPSGALAASLLSAELALDDGRAAEAASELSELHARKSRHIHALRLGLRAYEQAQDWERVLPVLAQLEKREALPPAVILGSRIRAYRALFKARFGDAGALWELYKSIPRRDRQTVEIIDAAAHALADSGEDARAARLAEEILGAQIAPRLLRLYTRLAGVPARERLAKAEKWRETHGDDPALLVALGELCMAEGLWGKAEEFLVRADALAPTRRSQRLLAELYERVERPADAFRYYKLAAAETTAAESERALIPR